MALDRLSLQRLSQQRLHEARALYRARHWSGAYYLAGYAIECAFKARIAARTEQHEFPPTPKIASRVHVHDLARLLIEADFPDMPADVRTEHWSTVRDWTVDSRYRDDISRSMARSLIRAIDGKGGVLRWARNYW